MNLLRPAWGFAALLLLCWLWPAGAAQAAGVQCSVNATQMNFGDVDPHSVTTNHDVRTSADISYSCTNQSNVATDVSLCLGVDDGGAGYNPRRMAGTRGGDLEFQVYGPAGYPTVLGTVAGNGGQPYLVYRQVPASSTVSGTLTIAGRLLQGQTIAADSYARYMSGTLVVDKKPTGTLADCTSGNQTLTFQLRAVANVTNACYVDAGPVLDFGTHPAPDLANPLTGNTAITVTCSGWGGTYRIGLDDGQHAVGGVRNLKGISSGDLIGYQLCQDAACTANWGNTLGSDTHDGWFLFFVPTRTYTVYARTLTSSAPPSVDTYTDTVTVFLYY